MNRLITKDVSDNIIAGAVMASSAFMSGASRIVEAHASDAKKVTVNKSSFEIPVEIGAFWFLVDTATHVDSATDIDTGTVAAATAYYLYAVTDESTISFKTSLSAANPTGYDAAHSKLLGGFTTDGSKDITAATIWDVKQKITTGGFGLMVDGVKFSEKAPLVSPALVTPSLGTPASGALDNCTSNTEADNNNTTQLATTAFVQRALALKLPSENLIGTPGGIGYGVGICPTLNLPSGMEEMVGTQAKGADNYGNYIFREGSVFGYIPWLVFRVGHASNPTYATYGVNSLDTKDIATYPWKQVDISAITKANPAVVTTLGAHMRTAGDYIWISNIRNDANWKDYSGKLYKVGTVVDAMNFNLQTAAGVDIDASGVAAAFSSATDQAEIIYTGAEAAGYAVPRGFIDGGIMKKGVFRFKYRASKVPNGTGWTMGSVKNGLPLSSAAAHNPFAGLTGGANYYYSSLDLAHRIDGADGAVNTDSIFFESSIFIKGILQILSIAHGQAATSTANCAWYLAGKNYPKGLNKNTAPASGLISPADYDDAVLTYESDGYSNCGKTGSGNPFAKTTHNGQNCGVADVNGLMYEINIGITCIATTAAIDGLSKAAACEFTMTSHGKTSGDIIQIGTAITQADWVGLNSKVWPITVTGEHTFTVAFNSSAFETAYDTGTDPGTVIMGTFYVAKPSTSMADFTHDNSTATGHWGATGVAAMMERIVLPWGNGVAFAQRLGSGANQVLSSDIYGTGWVLASAGFPRDANGTDGSGTALFGQDYYYVYVINEACLLVSAGWDGTSGAGVGFVDWSNRRDYAVDYVGAAAACYPETPPR